MVQALLFLQNDVIVSFEGSNGNTTGGNTIINNVGSAIDKTGNIYW